MHSAVHSTSGPMGLYGLATKPKRVYGVNALRLTTQST